MVQITDPKVSRKFGSGLKDCFSLMNKFYTCRYGVLQTANTSSKNTLCPILTALPEHHLKGILKGDDMSDQPDTSLYQPLVICMPETLRLREVYSLVDMLNPDKFLTANLAGYEFFRDHTVSRVSSDMMMYDQDDLRYETSSWLTLLNVDIPAILSKKDLLPSDTSSSLSILKTMILDVSDEMADGKSDLTKDQLTDLTTQLKDDAAYHSDIKIFPDFVKGTIKQFIIRKIDKITTKSNVPLRHVTFSIKNSSLTYYVSYVYLDVNFHDIPEKEVNKDVK